MLSAISRLAVAHGGGASIIAAMYVLVAMRRRGVRCLDTDGRVAAGSRCGASFAQSVKIRLGNWNQEMENRKSLASATWQKQTTCVVSEEKAGSYLLRWRCVQNAL